MAVLNKWVACQWLAIWNVPHFTMVEFKGSHTRRHELQCCSHEKDNKFPGRPEAYTYAAYVLQGPPGSWSIGTRTWQSGHDFPNLCPGRTATMFKLKWLECLKILRFWSFKHTAQSDLQPQYNNWVFGNVFPSTRHQQWTIVCCCHTWCMVGGRS